MRNTLTHNYPVVEVEWDDHFFNSGDLPLDEIINDSTEPYKGSYVGYLVHENKKILVLCANIWQTGELSCPMFIVKKLITKRSDKE